MDGQTEGWHIEVGAPHKNFLHYKIFSDYGFLLLCNILKTYRQFTEIIFEALLFDKSTAHVLMNKKNQTLAQFFMQCSLKILFDF